MKKRLWYLLLGFVAFYYCMHAAYDLPNLLYNPSRMKWLPDGMLPFFLQLVDIGATFLFALCPYLLLFHFYPTGKIVYGIMLIAVAVAVIFFINYQLAVVQQTVRLRYFFSNNRFFFSIYVVYGVVFYFVRYAQYKQLEQKELLLQNRQSELSFLRSQINPHFLFNSLNNIYALVYEGSQQALPAIAGLSDLLRYMLYDSTEKVPVEKEWEYIRKYIELQRLRFDHPVHVNLHISGPVDEVMIPPLLLIPFVENAFKHGDFSGNDDHLVVTLYCTTRKMNFHCSNKKGKGNSKDAGGGIGLANVKRRLELIYPDKHLLYIENGQDTFTVTIELLYE